MEDGKNGKTGAQPVASDPQKPIEAQILGQFIKDLSFENPSMGRVVLAPGENPNIKVEVNVEARRTGTDLYESGIDFKAIASHKDSTIYDLELVYIGVFRLRNVPDQALEPFLLINCPALIFRSRAVWSPTSPVRAASRRCCWIRSTSRSFSFAVSRTRRRQICPTDIFDETDDSRFGLFLRTDPRRA